MAGTKPRANTKPKPFAFVLMPFAAEFEDIYNLGIVAACKEAGAYCERADQQIFTGSILERIYNQISKADIIIADMTGRNPNVFYEVDGGSNSDADRSVHLARFTRHDLRHVIVVSDDCSRAVQARDRGRIPSGGSPR